MGNPLRELIRHLEAHKTCRTRSRVRKGGCREKLYVTQSLPMLGDVNLFYQKEVQQQKSSSTSHELVVSEFILHCCVFVKNQNSSRFGLKGMNHGTHN